MCVLVPRRYKAALGVFILARPTAALRVFENDDAPTGFFQPYIHLTFAFQLLPKGFIVDTSIHPRHDRYPESTEKSHPATSAQKCRA